MTRQSGERCDSSPTETIEIPMTNTTQCALNGAVGHLYDELAESAQEGELDVPSEAVFEAIETLYVATAEESIESVEISYNRRE